MKRLHLKTLIAKTGVWCRWMASMNGRVKAKKQPYRIIAKDQEVFCCAGLFDTWKAPDGRVVHSYHHYPARMNSCNNFMTECLPC